VSIGLVAAVVGGRLSYALANLPAFAASPASLVSLNLNLWDMPGGVILGLVGCIVYGLRQKINFWDLLDSLTPSFGVMMIAIGLANLASGSAFGEPARLPWSIFLWGEWRHPTQIYETVGAALILTLVLLRFRLADPVDLPHPGSGRLFLKFVVLSAGLRIFLEMFRGDGSLLFNQFRAAQVVAWMILAIGLYLLGKKSNQKGSNLGKI
jgi:prolipoprotein diacylglyceryltransferase